MYIYSVYVTIQTRLRSDIKIPCSFEATRKPKAQTKYEQFDNISSSKVSYINI